MRRFITGRGHDLTYRINRQRMLNVIPPSNNRVLVDNRDAGPFSKFVSEPGRLDAGVPSSTCF